jgi:tetratricopeptide (TPR) repeat protein/ADP-heptose:LPS heptosyltransferase
MVHFLLVVAENENVPMNDLSHQEKFLQSRKSVNEYMRLAAKLEKNGKIVEASSIYRKILEKFPKNKKANLRLRKLNSVNPIPDLVPLIEAKRFDEVEQLLLSNIERDNNNPNFWKLLASVYYNKKNYSLSLQCNQKALELDPSDFELMHQIGCDFLEQNDVGNAFKTFKYALLANPNFSKSHTKIGEIYSKIKDFKKAEDAWSKALEVNPEDTLAITYLGVNAVENLGDYEKAETYFKTALKYEPHDVQNCVNLASIYYEQGENDKSLELFDVWEEKNWPDLDEGKKAEFRYNYALALFADGKVSKGWDLYRSRVALKNIMPLDPKNIKISKLNTLEDAKRKRILLVTEQGVGDHLHTLGLLRPFIKKTKSQIILHVEPRLESLLQRSFPTVDVVTDFDLADPNIDYWMPYGDLGCLMEFNPKLSPICKPYIKHDPKLTLDWMDNLPKGRLNVGFSWRSGLVNPRRLNSYTFLRDWADIIDSEHVNPICLQYEDISEDLSELPHALKEKLIIPDFNLMDDFESLAALIDRCDLVFGPFTAPSIQAAAQGKETIIFNLKSGDRWSFGNSLHYTEYEDEWYSNCRHFVFTQKTKSELSNRIRAFIDKTHEQKMKNITCS